MTRSGPRRGAKAGEGDRRLNIALNQDCMEYMRSLPDKAFELAVVDPPYGIGVTGTPGGGNKQYSLLDPQ